MTAEIKLMEYWQYVCGMPWCKLLKPDQCLLKDKSVRLYEVDMNFTNEANWDYI